MSEESIRVLARFRPISSSEKRHGEEEALIDMPPIYLDAQSVKLVRADDKDNPQKPYKCTLDRIFTSDATQSEIFLHVGKPMVDAALEGYNATIFCYGQSGAGKSFTMFGPEQTDKERSSDKELDGVVPRCIEYLLKCLNNRANLVAETLSGGDEASDDENAPSPVKEWKIYVEFIQIYKNDLLDLLDAKTDKKLRIRQNFQTDTTQVENLSKVSITNTKDFDKSLIKAIGNRVVAKHALNAVSSRSHMLVMLSVEQQMVDASVRTSRLNFGDLAGSEDVTKALGDNPDPERLKEAIAINSSLSALTTAIAMLSRGQRPSFRSSALTHILQDSLGGNSKTTMVVNASPHIRNRPETIRTLRFAQTAKKVKNKAKVNDRLTRAQLERKIIELEAENAQLKAQLVECEHQEPGHFTPTLGPTRRNSDSLSPLHKAEKGNKDDTPDLMKLDTIQSEPMSVIREEPQETQPEKDKTGRKSETNRMSILDVVDPPKRASHIYATSAPALPKTMDLDDGPFISSVGLMRHASLTTGLAVIQPHESSTLLGMKVLREEIEKLSRLLKREQEDNEEYSQKNLQLEREVEALQTKLRDAQEKIDKLERVFNHYNQNVSNEAEDSKDENDGETIQKSSSSIIMHPSPFHSLSLNEPTKTDQLVLELQKENMKLQYMKEMHEEKIRDLTQQLLVVETLLDTNDNDSVGETEDEEEETNGK